MSTIREFFPKSGNYFPIFEKEKRKHPPSPSLVAPLLLIAHMHSVTLWSVALLLLTAEIDFAYSSMKLSIPVVKNEKLSLNFNFVKERVVGHCWGGPSNFRHRLQLLRTKFLPRYIQYFWRNPASSPVEMHFKFS